MSSFNFVDCFRRMPIGPVPTGLNGALTLDAVRSGARGRAVR